MTCHARPNAPTPAGLRLACALLAVMAAGLSGLACDAEVSAPPLPATEAAKTGVSVSGLSAGAYMAGQFQVAHSSIVAGAGLVAGGPYGCAQSQAATTIPGPGRVFINLGKAINGCMQNGLKFFGEPNASRLAEVARKLAAAGKIDAVDHLAKQRVYLFSAAKDRTVVEPIVAAAKAFYLQVGVPGDRLTYLKDQPGGHALLTVSEGQKCGRSAKPYLNACNYDQAGAILKWIYGPLESRTSADPASFVAFDQHAFTGGIKDHGLSQTGAAYVPRSCRNNAEGAPKCRVHVVFHGCGQGEDGVDSRFVRRSGYAEWAEGNRLVILFPHAAVSTLNPDACWDWWGYSGPDYLTKNAPQIRAVRRMLDRLMSPRLAL